MNDPRGDGAQKQAFDATKTSGPHHDLVRSFFASYIRYRFGRLSGSRERLEDDASTFAFSYRVLQRLGRRL